MRPLTSRMHPRVTSTPFLRIFSRNFVLNFYVKFCFLKKDWIFLTFFLEISFFENLVFRNVFQNFFRAHWDQRIYETILGSRDIATWRFLWRSSRNGMAIQVVGWDNMKLKLPTFFFKSKQVDYNSEFGIWYKFLHQTKNFHVFKSWPIRQAFIKDIIL